MDAYTELAKKTIDHYLHKGDILEVPTDLPPEMLQDKAGVFVTLHKKDGDLRGCIGTFQPTQENIAKEIIQNAVSSAIRDPRFPSLTKEELNEIDINVDVLTAPEPTKSPGELDVKKYGILVKTQDNRSGLLLPDIEGVDNVEQQIAIACRKGGIDPDFDQISLFKFKVIRHK